MYDKNGKNNPNYRHGACKERIYYIYTGMKERCTNPHSVRYPYYGGRGIKICEEWATPRTGRIAFMEWAFKNGYKNDLTLDRRDVNGDYSPQNCQWVDKGFQSFNQRKRKSKLGVRGVYYRESTKRYLVSIGENGKQHYVGSFTTLDAAIEARKKAELKYFGMTMDDEQLGRK